MAQSGEVSTKLVPVFPTQRTEVAHPVPDLVRFTRVRHVKTVGYVVLVVIVTVTHSPQRYRGYKIIPERI